MSVPTKIEYRVIPVTRYTVTRYEEHGENAGHVSEKGEYGNAEIAYEVGYALAKAEHEQMGWPAFDDRMQYPHRITMSFGTPSGTAPTFGAAAACADPSAVAAARQIIA